MPEVAVDDEESVEVGGRHIRLRDCFTMCNNSVFALQPSTGEIETISLAAATQPQRATIELATATPFGAHAAAEAGRKVKCGVLINPASGKGKGLEIWFSVREFVERCDHAVEFEVTETEYAGHAWKIAHELDLSAYDAMLLVGGDGLLHEFVNGLMSRDELPAADNLPALGVLPAGSGNGLATSIAKAAGLPCSAASLMFLAIKGQCEQMDMQEYSLVDEVGQELAGKPLGMPSCQPQAKRYSFLNLNWGMIADIDIESERCRCCGPMRFDLEAVCKICNLRNYQGRVVYQKDPGSPPETIEGPFVAVMAANVPWISEDCCLNPRAGISSGKVDLLIVKDAGRCVLLDIFSDMESGAHLDSPFVQNFQVASFTLFPEACEDGCCCLCSWICCCCCPRVQEDTGNLVLDGEGVQYNAIQCNILPRRLPIFSFPVRIEGVENDSDCGILLGAKRS